MSLRTESEIREAIVAEARTWLKTPYRHEGDVKGVGVDCAMILVRVFQVAAPEFVPTDLDPRPYPQDWYLHQDEERYLDVVRQLAVQIENGAAKQGDIEVYNFGRCASHGSIVISESLMIHSYRPHRQVSLHERRALVERLHSTWSVFR